MDSRSPYPLRRMEELLRAILDKAPALINLIPVNTVSGPAAELTGAVPGLPVRSLTAAITPVQDLHGYNKPWTPGAGSNIWDEEWEKGSITNDTGANTTDNNNIRGKNYINVTAGEPYYFYIGVDKSLRLHWYNSEKVQISSETAKNEVKTAPTGATYLRIRTTQTYGDTYNHNIAVNSPATVTTYSPYSNVCTISGWTGANIHVSPAQDQDGTVYPVSWESEAGTVYGGTVNVTTGVLTVDWWSIAVDGETSVIAVSNRTNSIRFGVTTDTEHIHIYSGSASAGYIKCDTLESRSAVYGSDVVGVSIPMGTSTTRRIYMSIPKDEHAVGETDEEKIAAWLTANPTTIAYRLEEPMTYQLTPTEVRTLTEGPTVVRADTGDVSVTYHVHA